MLASISARGLINTLTGICAAALLFIFLSYNSTSYSQDTGKVFELRIYTATAGNLANLHARFRDHTTEIFKKHGMKVVAYWTPTDPEEAEDTLMYVLEHASQAAADASWEAFRLDPEWQRVSAESNANGPILAGVERKFMKATDFSPMQ